MIYDLLGFAIVAAISLVAGTALASSRSNPFPRKLVMGAIVMHIAGSVARFDMMRIFYGAAADANRYYYVGLEYAHRAWNLDLSVFGPAHWFGGPGRWWGTPFMEKVSGVVLTFIGPTLRGEFLVFGMLAFFGLYWIALAVYRAHPGPGAVRFAAWTWFWPSLLFWPSSVGKEAVTVFAIGLTCLGYVGRQGRIRWLPFLTGMGVAFALRPHVAAVLAMASAGAYWLQSWKRPSPRRVAEALVAAVLSIVVLSGVSSQLGFEADLEGVQEYIDFRSDFTVRGGSQIGGAASGPAAIPMAFVNIWMRPFLWEAHNVMALISALELTILWLLAWRNRKALRVALSGWWGDRLLSFAVPLMLGYTVMIGLTFANLGIIARQRAPIFPFLILILLGGGKVLSAAGRRVPRRAVPARRRLPPSSGARKPDWAGGHRSEGLPGRQEEAPT